MNGYVGLKNTKQKNQVNKKKKEYERKLEGAKRQMEKENKKDKRLKDFMKG